MNKEELLDIFECQKEQENATENLLNKKKKAFEERCNKLYKRFNETLDKLITPEIIEIVKIVGAIDIKIDGSNNPYMRFHFHHGYMDVELIRENKRTIDTYRLRNQDGTYRWVVYDVSKAAEESCKFCDSQLAYSSELMDVYETFLNEIESHISEFYQKLADKNQARIDKRNQNLANTNTGEEEKKTKTYTIQITIEEEN